jgi:prevent-host-death family protein
VEEEAKVTEHEPVTETVNVSQARQAFSQLLNKVFRKETRVVVEKSGIPVAAIVSAQDLQQLERLDEERRRDFAILNEIRDTFKDVPDDELEREVNRAFLQARERARANQGTAAKHP